MTEDDAKKKWCAFARVPIPDMGTDKGIPVGNRYDSNDGGEWNHCLCIGSRCMAWRDLFETVNVQEPAAAFGKSGVQTVARQVKSGGFCGLAGRP